jgi:16S rRNA (guanine527-N7)-methyltransferase
MVDAIYTQFSELLQEHSLTLTTEQWKQFELYYDVLVEWNEKMNLTGITERDQVFLKHFYDSISLSFYVPMDSIQSIADIGSGAGFPSLPLKILFPHLKVTIVDSLNKRIQFLNHVVTTLKLSNVQCIHGRAEDLGHDRMMRDSFDLVTARAVARMNVLNEFCLPFVKKGGIFAAMKGSDPKEELKEAEYSLKQLKGKVQQVYSFELPIEQSSRHVILINKVHETPKAYPRKAGTPMKSPLV